MDEPSLALAILIARRELRISAARSPDAADLRTSTFCSAAPIMLVTQNTMRMRIRPGIRLRWQKDVGNTPRPTRELAQEGDFIFLAMFLLHSDL
jgi:hypothetical protein